LIEPGQGDVHVTVIGRTLRCRPGIVVHRVDRLARQDLRHRHGIPLTSPARTICDLAASEPPNIFERAANEARVQRLLSDRELKRALKRSPSRKGTRALRALLDDGPAITRSEAERLMLKLIGRANLPKPITNAPVSGYTVDFLWPAQRLIMEVDGFAFHGHRHAFERDRKRDAALTAAGYRVIRVTWRQLTTEPLEVIAMLARALTSTG
jgi:very-short-patch-repair endonuclease